MKYLISLQCLLKTVLFFVIIASNLSVTIRQTYRQSEQLHHVRLDAIVRVCAVSLFY